MRHRFRSWLFAYYYRCNWRHVCITLSHPSLSHLHNWQAVDDDESDDTTYNEFATAPVFSCRWGKHDLFTHAPAHHLLYNLGKNLFVGENRNSMSLDVRSATHWLSFTDSKVKKAMAKITIKVPGGRMGKAWWAQMLGMLYTYQYIAFWRITIDSGTGADFLLQARYITRDNNVTLWHPCATLHILRPKNCIFLTGFGGVGPPNI